MPFEITSQPMQKRRKMQKVCWNFHLDTVVVVYVTERMCQTGLGWSYEHREKNCTMLKLTVEVQQPNNLYIKIRAEIFWFQELTSMTIKSKQ